MNISIEWGSCMMGRMSSQWYETFFQGIALETWDRCTPPEHTKAEADFFVDALQCKPGAHLLDIPCGNGRHCRELAGRDYEMTGIDLSRDYIDSARGKEIGRASCRERV